MHRSTLHVILIHRRASKTSHRKNAASQHVAGPIDSKECLSDSMRAPATTHAVNPRTDQASYLTTGLPPADFNDLWLFHETAIVSEEKHVKLCCKYRKHRNVLTV